LIGQPVDGWALGGVESGSDNGLAFDIEIAMTEFDLNQAVAEQICATGEWNGRRFGRGEFVALLDGNVVAVADNLEGCLQVLRELDQDPDRGMVCEVAPPVVDVIR
jgi:hypothetical protein